MVASSCPAAACCTGPAGSPEPPRMSAFRCTPGTGSGPSHALHLLRWQRSWNPDGDKDARRPAATSQRPCTARGRACCWRGRGGSCGGGGGGGMVLIGSPPRPQRRRRRRLFRMGRLKPQLRVIACTQRAPGGWPAGGTPAAARAVSVASAASAAAPATSAASASAAAATANALRRLPKTGRRSFTTVVPSHASPRFTRLAAAAAYSLETTKPRERRAVCCCPHWVRQRSVVGPRCGCLQKQLLTRKRPPGLPQTTAPSPQLPPSNVVVRRARERPPRGDPCKSLEGLRARRMRAGPADAADRRDGHFASGHQNADTSKRAP
eukprot:350700-Chlamydomonas_euryale.AAC.5